MEKVKDSLQCLVSLRPLVNAIVTGLISDRPVPISLLKMYKFDQETHQSRGPPFH